MIVPSDVLCESGSLAPPKSSMSQLPRSLDRPQGVGFPMPSKVELDFLRASKSSGSHVTCAPVIGVPHTLESRLPVRLPASSKVLWEAGFPRPRISILSRVSHTQDRERFGEVCSHSSGEQMCACHLYMSSGLFAGTVDC